MSDDNKIINESNQLKPARRTWEITVKVLFSAILTIFAVLLTIALWGFSGIYLYERLFTPEYMQKTTEMFVFLVIVAFAAFVIMFLWQQYNLRMFGKKDRRAFPAPVPDEHLATMYNTTMEEIHILRSAKIVSLDPDKNFESAIGPKTLTDEHGNVARLGNFDPLLKNVQKFPEAKPTAPVV